MSRGGGSAGAGAGRADADGGFPAAYREASRALCRGYEADARFNGLSYDRAEEREQVDRYAEAVAPPGTDDRLPAWGETELDPAAVREAARADLEAAQ